MYCTTCGSPNEPGARYCTKCGASLAVASAADPASEPEHVPPVAGEDPLAADPLGIPPAVPYTPPASGYLPPSGYGVPQTFDPQVKSKLVAGLLGIFLGWLGVHRFYLGYQNIGIAQLALGVIGMILAPFTCGLILIGAEIWGLIEGIMILVGSIRTDAQGRPLRD